MVFARIAAAAIAALFLWCATAGAGGPLRPFKHGYWAGGAYTDDRTGAFTHCSAGVAYDSGINLFVLVTGGYRWWLGLINPQWSLTPNAKIPIKLQLDAGAPFSGLASIPSGQLLLVSLPDSSKLLGAFRRSSRLSLDAEGQSFSFKLGGTPAVMDQLADCVRTSVALAAPAPRREASTAPSAVSDATGATDGSTTPTAAAASAPSTSARKSRPGAAAGSPLPDAAPRSAAPAAVASGASDEAATTASRTPVTAASSAPAVCGAECAPDRDGAALRTSLSSAPLQAGPPVAGPPATAAQPRPSSIAAPPLAFTSVAPATPTLPSAATAAELPPEPATATAVEEVRLATDFVANARLPEARLVVADKPPALADFTAVWRSEDAAGAVKIIPAGPDVSAIGIASNLITVDPQLCKGDFSAARFRTDVANSVVFSAVLSCSEANERRVTEYFITPRHQGGFVVFAVIRSNAAGEMPGFEWQKIDVLSRAAVQAAEGQG
jgi:hypothetical protein